MSWSIKLIRVKGIDIKLHLTFVLILIWAAYRWGVSIGAGPKGALFGVVVILLLFVCVTLHELAHSLTAMHFGVKVRGITLLPIGGISQMEEMPKKPKEELLMSVAGPLTNFVIAAVLILVSVLFRWEAGLSAQHLNEVLGSVRWAALPSYLAIANIMLGVFNLLPAYPMDGGRVLRSILAMRLDYAKATAWAVNIGQGMAWLLGLWGVLAGAWTLVIIAIFIYLGASQEGQLVEAKGVLGKLNVRQAMTGKFQTVTPDAPLSRVVDLILHSFQTDFPVVEGGRLAGFISEFDLVGALKTYGPEVAVKQVMKTDVPTVDPDETLFEARQRMGLARLRSMPVLKEGRLEGMLTADDISEAFLFTSLKPDLLRRSVS
ncbi:MAG TPA: site-2 protease family protein [Candidatus Desulfaltia sp.]|nr:site-2 protease family protein [Candidatus Desulfaltia sp.]